MKKKSIKTLTFWGAGLLHVDHSLRNSMTVFNINQKLKEFSRFSMVSGGTGLLDFEDSLGASNMGFVKCINSLGFEGDRSPRF